MPFSGPAEAPNWTAASYPFLATRSLTPAEKVIWMALNQWDYPDDQGRPRKWYPSVDEIAEATALPASQVKLYLARMAAKGWLEILDWDGRQRDNPTRRVIVRKCPEPGVSVASRPAGKPAGAPAGKPARARPGSRPAPGREAGPPLRSLSSLERNPRCPDGGSDFGSHDNENDRTGGRAVKVATIAEPEPPAEAPEPDPAHEDPHVPESPPVLVTPMAVVSRKAAELVAEPGGVVAVESDAERASRLEAERVRQIEAMKARAAEPRPPYFAPFRPPCEPLRPRAAPKYQRFDEPKPAPAPSPAAPAPPAEPLAPEPDPADFEAWSEWLERRLASAADAVRAAPAGPREGRFTAQAMLREFQGFSPGHRDVLARLGPERRACLIAKAAARPPGTADTWIAFNILPHREAVDPILYKPLEALLGPPPPPPPPMPPTVVGLIQAMPGSPPGWAPALAEMMAQDFGTSEDRKLWKAFLEVAIAVQAGRFPAEALADAYRQGMNPESRNKGAVFNHALQKNGWQW